MRRFAPVPRRASSVRLFSGIIIALGIALTTISAQIPSRNVNMVSGTGWPEGDPFLQRQNEPSIAASTRNPLHLLAGSNDYRTVDVPGLPDGKETGDAWLGLFKSLDGGQRWTSTLLPGYPQDQSPAGKLSPLYGFEAGADAVVRAGTHGLVYYSGLAFNRGVGGKSAVFVSRFIDNNNLEAGDPFAYLGNTLVAQSNGEPFLDKPWMAVDMPRGNPTMCSVSNTSAIATGQNGKKRKYADQHLKQAGKAKKGSASNPQQIPAGAVYVAYSSIVGEGSAIQSQIYLSKSTDCGATWSTPMRISRAEDQVNQGATIAIDPRNGNVYVAWRRFDPNINDTNDLDAMMVARVPVNGKKADAPGVARKFARPPKGTVRNLEKLFEHRDEQDRDEIKSQREVEEGVDQFDLGLTGFNFRTNAYPTMAIDGSGRVYIAWTQRGFSADSGAADGARVVVVTTPDGKTFTRPQNVDDRGQKGHQLMPSMAFAGGKLMMVYYDLRETKAMIGTSDAVHDRIISDSNKTVRHTIDIRSVMASPGDFPNFDPSVKVSDYLMGIDRQTGQVEQMQVNPPNLPMFKQGTVPFIGDYIDIAPAPAFIPQKNGKWAYNVADNGVDPVFHTAWTDNRDVRPPKINPQTGKPDWTKYTPAKLSPNQASRTSLFDGSVVPECTDQDGNPGSRNQNVYSARITPKGLLAGSPGNAKTLGFRLDANGNQLTDLMQRGFVVFAQNTEAVTKSYRMRILSQPPGGRASFDQFPLPPYTAASPAPRIAIEMIVPPKSTATRTVYVSSIDPHASVSVDVSELVDLTKLASPALYPTAPELTNGAGSVVVLNPDIENPDIENPDIENTGVLNPDIENAEVYNPDIENPDIENPDIENPDIENPDIENPDIENPDIENPDIENPDIENVRVANPDIENPDIENPDIENPDIENPDIENPDIENPDIENGAIADTTWRVTNTGNTTASFNVNLFLSQQTLPQGVHTQLILLKTYRTPVTVPNRCQLAFQTRNILLANIPNPKIVAPNGTVSDPNDPAETNATLWLSPGEEGRIVMRVIDDDTSNNVEIPKLNPDGSPVLNEDGSQKFVLVDPGVVPSQNVTPAVQQQSVNTDDAETGVIVPEVITPPPAPAAQNDATTTAEQTAVTINVLANDNTAFGSTKLLSFHPNGMAAHSGGGPGDVTFQPSTGFLYTQRGVVDPALNVLIGRLSLPPSNVGVAYQQANPRTGINYQRSNIVTSGSITSGTMSALDARPDSPTFHRYLAMPPLADAVLTFGMDTVHNRLYVVHGDSTSLTTSRTWFSAIDIDPASAAFHTVKYTIALPQGLRGTAVAVNSRTQQVYIATGPNQGTTNLAGVYVVDGTQAAPAATHVFNTFGAWGIAINESSNQVFAASSNSNLFQLQTIDGTTLAVASISTSVPMRFNNADERLVVHEATGQVFMRLGNVVVVIDGKKGSPSRNTVLAAIPVGADANNADMAIDQQLGRIVTTGAFDFRADIIDAVTHQVTSVPLPNGGIDVAIDPIHHVAFVSTSLTAVIKIDLTGVKPSVSIPVFIEAGGPIVNPVTHRAYINGTTDATGIAVFSANGMMAEIPVANDVGRFLFSVRQEQGNRFFIIKQGNQAGTSNNAGTLIGIDGANDTPFKYLNTLPNPFGIGMDQTTARIYVASLSGDTAPGGLRVFDAANLDSTPVDASFTTGLTGSGFPLNTPNAFLSFGRFVVPNHNDHRVYTLVMGGSPSSVAVYDPVTNTLAPLDGRAGTRLFDHQTSIGESWGRVNIIRVLQGLNRVILGYDNGTTTRIVVLDGTTHAVLHNVIAGRHGNRHSASYVIADETMGRLFISHYINNTVTMFDAATMIQLASVNLPQGPSSQALNLIGHRLYVSSIDAKVISAINYTSSTLTLNSSVKLPLVAYFMASDDAENRLYTGGGDSIDESGAMSISDAPGQLGANVSVTQVGAASNGTVTMNSDYSVTYKPNFGFSGVDSFTYTIAAPSGNSTGTVTINVVPSNPVAVAFADSYSATVNAPLSVTAPGPLTNDAAGAGLVTMVMDAFPTHGQLIPQANGAFSYVPQSNFTGTDSFTYHAVGTLGSSNPAQVTITIAAHADSIEVTNTNDSGAGSLRNAITIANVEPNSVIGFNITSGNQSPSGAYIIQPASPLPTITQPVVINGYTQPGSVLNTHPTATNAVIKVWLRGSSAISTGLQLSGGSSTVRGLAISGFNNTGIQFDTAAGNTVEGSFVGTDPTGLQTGAGNGSGVASYSNNNLIGGTSLAARNLIAGNAQDGIRVGTLSSGATVLSDGTGTFILNNLIGTNATGIARLDNGSAGISVTVPNVTIGGTTPAYRNVIAGSTSNSAISSSPATFSSSPTAPATILRSPTNPVIQGNYIGVGADGITVGTGAGGIFVSGEDSLIGGSVGLTPGACTGACNLIAGANGTGVSIGAVTRLVTFQVLSSGDGTTVEGNFIGTNLAGTAASANNGSGVSIGAPDVVVRNNLISGNNGSGVSVGPTMYNSTTMATSGIRASIIGNYIGVNRLGTARIANSNGVSVSVPSVTIGGADPVDRNIISGNTNAGISTFAQTTGVNPATILSIPSLLKVFGNYIGVAANGNSAIANGGGGINVNGTLSQIGGVAPGAGNVISGNTGTGIYIGTQFDNSTTLPLPGSLGQVHTTASLTKVLGNYIGTDASGAAALPNTLGGIQVTAPDAAIGDGTVAGRNVISGNFGNGISLSQNFTAATNAVVSSAAGTKVLGNYIGLNAAGSITVANGTSNFFSGISVAVPYVTIGGPNAGDRNVIAGHSGPAISSFAGRPQNSATILTYPDHLTIEGNYIGTDATGVNARPNLGGGVNVSGADSMIKNNLIAGNTTTAPGNSSLGVNVSVNFENNTSSGLPLGTVYSSPDRTKVIGNIIGLNVNGVALPNDQGIYVAGPSVTIGGSLPAERNVVSGNTRGISTQTAYVNSTNTPVATSAGTKIAGNYIGLDTNGTSMIPNTQIAIDSTSPGVTIGGPTAADGNYVVPNTSQSAIRLSRQIGSSGALISAGGLSTVQNNVIGLDQDLARLNARGTPIRIESAGNQILSNTIAGNGTGAVPTFSAISVSASTAGTADNNVIRGNYIGTTASGATGVHNFGAGITLNNAGATTIDDNTLVGGNDIGISIMAGGPGGTAHSNVITGNRIGIMPNGVTVQDPLNRVTLGIMLTSNGGTINGTMIGGNTTATRNVIGALSSNGIGLYNSGVTNTSIRGNYIGVDKNGAPLRDAGNNVIINPFAGVWIADSSDNIVGGAFPADGNVVSNYQQVGVGVTGTAQRNRILSNRIYGNVGPGIDLSSGANNSIAAPVVSNASNDDSTTQVSVDLSHMPAGNYTVQFFASVTCSAGGERLVGSAGVAQPGAAGISLDELVNTGESITATATDSGNNTSRFSACATVSAAASTVVTNTNDTGAGSLRAAMTAANSTPGVQTITFNIPGATPAAPAVITVNTALPAIADSVDIDGTSQPGWDGLPVIVVRSPSDTMGLVGFTLNANNITIRGLSIQTFSQGILAFQNFGGHMIRQNWIGTNRADATGLGNGSGIQWRASGSMIRDNVISGNSGTAVDVLLAANSNIFLNNKIGVRTDGTVSLPNAGNGVTFFDGPQNNTLDGNLISGNTGWGVALENNGASAVVAGTTFRSNWIGVGSDGSDLGNLAGGIRVDRAPNTRIGVPSVAPNVISGNGGNLAGQIGVGIHVLGNIGPAPIIQGNYIGLDPTGVIARSNNNKGIVLEGPAVVGGNSIPDRNYISGNGAGDPAGAGIIVSPGGDSSSIINNVIGLNVNSAAVGNSYAGITVRTSGAIGIGGSADGANVISGNGSFGISIVKVAPSDTPANVQITHNFIGTDASATLSRPNGSAGINVGDGTGHRIGGIAGAGNTIYFNGGSGIRVTGATTSVRIQENSIVNNTGLGIDLAGDGVTVNDGPVDSDSGPNGLSNFATMISATTTGSQNTNVVFDANVLNPGNQYTVEFFASSSCDASGHGEGSAFAGSRLVSGGQGNNINFALGLSIAPGQVISATTTDANGNTSEFSNCVTVMSDQTPIVNSVEPSTTFASGQMLTLKGSNFQAAGGGAVVIRSGSNDYPGTYLWYNDGSKLIVRTANNAPNGPASLIVKNGSVESAPIAITIQPQEAAPIFMHMRNGNCSGFGGPGDTTQAWSGGDLYLVASGIDTTGAKAVFTPVAGGPPTIVSAYVACGFPGGGDVAVQVQVPTLPAGNYNVTMRSSGVGQESADSNAKAIQIIDIFLNAVSGGSANGNCGSCGGPGGPFPPFAVGTVKDNQPVIFTASGLANNSGTSTVGPNGSGVCSSECLAPGLPNAGLIGRINGGHWFFIGTGTTVANQWGQGYLELAMNDSNYTDNSGGWTVTVKPQ